MSEYCQCCGAPIIKYWHNLNKGLCAAMIRIYATARLNPVRISELLNHTQVCNFQKLHYWGLVEKGVDSGFWRLTSDGEQFVRGKITQPIKAQTFRGKLVAMHEKKVFIDKIIEGYQWKDDYMEASE